MKQQMELKIVEAVALNGGQLTKIDIQEELFRQFEEIKMDVSTEEKIDMAINKTKIKFVKNGEYSPNEMAKQLGGSIIDPSKKEKILMKNIKNTTLEEAMEVYKTMGVSFIIRDGQLKGMCKENKEVK